VHSAGDFESILMLNLLVIAMKTSKTRDFIKSGWFVCILLAVVLSCLFWRCFLPEYVLFSNDGPLGLQNSTWQRLPQAFLGQWYDMNSVGINAGASLPDLSTLIRWILGPVGYAKFLIPISLWLLGAAAYFFFRRSGLTVMASTLGGLAACLTTGFFSNACWGAGPPIIGFGMDFLALAALAKRDRTPFWVAPALAGMAVGINVMEAADIGALFSLLIAGFTLFQALSNENSSISVRMIRAIGRTIIVALSAGFIAAYAVSALVGATIKGVVGTNQDEQTKMAHYDFATQWSMPKRETLALVVPNLFGCSVVTPGAANYWGGLGTDPAWDRYLASDRTGPPPGPEHYIRHTGRGIYIGVFVIMLAFWAILQSFRKNSVFTVQEGKMVWFWSAAAIVSLLLAYGRFAPFYQLVYKLPYFSTIRNPDKFLHIVTFSSIVLFAYGVHGFCRSYLEIPLKNSATDRFKTWWSSAGVFERRWVAGSILSVILSLIGWAVYVAMRGHVEDYLVQLQKYQAGGGSDFDVAAAHEIASSQLSFSLTQVGWFVLFLTMGVALVLLILKGRFAGARANWAGILLGVLLVVDLTRANLPYIVFWNYQEKYETYGPNPIIRFLREKPYEHRVAELPFRPPGQLSLFDNLYQIEWKQQLFPYYDIQTLDIVQMPRMPQDLEAFERSLVFPGVPPLTRRWELTDTRYLLGPAGYLEGLNQQFDPVLRRFRVISNFKLVGKPGVDRPHSLSQLTAAPVQDGEYGLFEFSGALPRAKLYANWQSNSPASIAAFTTNTLDENQLKVLEMTSTNDFLTLKQLASPEFDPATSVLLPHPLSSVSDPSFSTNEKTGTVVYTSYHASDIKLETTSPAPTVLMLCDKYDPSWYVTVDGKDREVLRCDFIFRGVFLEPGKHEVEFRFRPNIKMFYVNLVAIFIGICLLGYAIVVTREPSKRSE
jgi:hypothetical protein